MQKPLNLMQRRANIAVTAKRYQTSNKKQCGIILTEFCKNNNYNRSYASYLLHNWGRKVKLKVNGQRTIFIFGKKDKKRKRNYNRIYDEKIRKHLEYLWAVADGICSKRFVVWLRENIPVLENFEELTLDEQTRQKLLKISASSIDRLLAPIRKKTQIKPRHLTKPGTLLKHQIPIRTFSEWEENEPGFVEIDLVSHDGGNARGEFAQTLDLTDICTCWTETRAVRNKAQRWVFEALQDIIKNLPFELKGIDSDNGGEFINQPLKRFCEKRKLNFTRSRPYRKNDNCYVEQKNYSIVRRAVGYYRYDTVEELTLLNQIYHNLRLYTNFFQPVLKLASKERVGSKVKKKYDIASTPFKRVLKNDKIPDTYKQSLIKQYGTLNPVELKRNIARLQEKLFKFAEEKALILKQKNGVSYVPKIHYI